MDKNMNEMQERHEKEVKEFQDACSHSEISDWMDYMWAPGHMGLPVKICKRCNKIMETTKWDVDFIQKVGDFTIDTTQGEKLGGNKQ